MQDLYRLEQKEIAAYGLHGLARANIFVNPMGQGNILIDTESLQEVEQPIGMWVRRFGSEEIQVRIISGRWKGDYSKRRLVKFDPARRLVGIGIDLDFKTSPTAEVQYRASLTPQYLEK